MRTSALFTVSGIGVLGFLVVTILMWWTLDQFEGTPAGNMAKLANDVQGQFQFDGAGVDASREGKETILRVEYRTSRNSKYDLEVQNREMDKVAQYAAAGYAEERKQEVDRVHVTRHELRGSGCFQDTYTSNLDWVRKKNVFDLED